MYPRFLPTRRAATVAALCLALGQPACERDRPQAPTPEQALARLHAALTTGSPPLEAVADTELYPEAELLWRVTHFREMADTPLTDHAVRLALGEIRGGAAPARPFTGAAALLGRGRCARLGRAALPDPLRELPPPEPDWPPAAHELRGALERRLRGAFALRVRCGDGPAFTAAFVPAAGGAPRAVWVGAGASR